MNRRDYGDSVDKLVSVDSDKEADKLYLVGSSHINILKQTIKFQRKK